MLAAGAAYFVLGGLWYSPLLFAKDWMAEMRLSLEQIEAAKGRGMGRIFAATFALGLLMAFVLALLLQARGAEAVQGRDVWRAALSGGEIGLLVSLGFAATTTATNYLYERCSPRLFLINAGYPAVGGFVVGLILGAWR